MKSRIIAITVLVLLLVSLFPSLPAKADTGERFHYIGPWIWQTGPPEPAWVSPAGTLSCIDLRSIPEMSRQGGNGGRAIFVTDVPLGSGYLLFSRVFEDTVNPVLTGVLEGTWNIDIEAYTSRGIIWELLVQEGDPTGEMRWKPLKPGVDGILVIHLDGYSPVEFWQDEPKSLSPKDARLKALAKRLAERGMSWDVINKILSKGKGKHKGWQMHPLPNKGKCQHFR